MINTASLYKARYWVYASTGYYEGTALSRSPKTSCHKYRYNAFFSLHVFLFSFEKGLASDRPATHLRYQGLVLGHN